MNYKIVSPEVTQSMVDKMIREKGEDFTRKFLLKNMSEGVIDQKLRVGNCMGGTMIEGCLNVTVNTMKQYTSTYIWHGKDKTEKAHDLSGQLEMPQLDH